MASLWQLTLLPDLNAMIRYDYEPAKSFLPGGSIDSISDELKRAQRSLVEGTGAGSEFLGWRSILLDPNDALIENTETLAARIREEADVFLVIGIGGSYLGARAVIEALRPYFGHRGPEIVFAGHHMSGKYLKDLLGHLEGKSVFVNVISKSGTTLEPALAFRFVRKWLEERFEDADRRIIVTTDPEAGALNVLKNERGYMKFVIPPDVGGRFSVLTAVGMLPIAVAGIDVRSLCYGAVALCKQYTQDDANAALDYAAVRYLLHEEGKTVEVMAVFEPRLSAFGAWWQQLFGESEGKEHKGLYPAVAQYSTDLHSLGQFMQDGRRTLVETFLMLEEDEGDAKVPKTGADLDGLDYLVGRSMTEINRQAYQGTANAHASGGVPLGTVWLDSLNAESLGACIYFFEHAVAVGGYLLGVNPFDQPGVEAYKQEMFSLLGRP
ncbi:MAG: glucose-6-phosphate isomerase [Rhodothermales bacterium]